MVINLATIDFCPSGGGQKPEEVLTETITTNGSYSYSPSEGSVFSEANISVSVPVPGEEVLSETITTNGSYSYSPSAGNMFSSVDVSVDVVPDTETLIQILDENGEYSFSPSGESFYDGVVITVAVPQKEEVICSETITENGEFHYYAPSGKVFDTVEIEVSVPQKEEVICSETITENGEFHYYAPSGKVFDSVEIEVSVPNKKYIYEDGVVTGLSDLGWDDDDIGYFQDNVPHNSWEDSKWVVSQANKNLYGVVNDSNLSTYTSNSDMVFLPKFSTANRTNWGSAFYGFSQIKGIPKLDYDAVMQNGLFLEKTFEGCSSLETISPMPSGLKVTGCVLAFKDCINLKKVPLFDTSECNLFDGMFNGCSSLETIPLFDMTNATSCGSMFEGCVNLKTVPPLQFSSLVYNTGSMFKNCSSLVSVPALDTSGSDNFDDMFEGCTSLREINGIDFSGVTESITGAIWDNTAGNNITKFIVNGKLNNYYFDFSGLTNIDYQSVKSILQAANNTDNVEEQKDLVFNITMTDQNNELAGLDSSAASKGWTITGLTLV